MNIRTLCSFILPVTVTIAACSSSSNGTGSSSGGNTNVNRALFGGGGGGGGGGTGTGGGGGGGTGSGCGSSSGSSGSSSCTDQEINDYGSCVIGKCDPQLQKCYGPNYQSGSYAGLCGGFLTCMQGCACNDLGCYQKCQGQYTTECQSCLNEASACFESCPKPKCMTTSITSDAGTTTGKTCADLQTCCNAIADATKKNNCLSSYNAVKASGDALCNAAYAGYKSDCGG